jgi:probable blue pigment (indigoidine) exporter
VAAVGVGLVVLHPGASFDGIGVLAALGANVSFAAGAVASRRLPVMPHRLAATGWQLLASAVLIAPLALAVDGVPARWTMTSIAGAAYLSLVATGLAFVVWFRGQRLLPHHVPPLLGLAAPITGAALGWLVLGESLSPVQLAGFAVSIGAIASGARSAAGRPVVVAPHSAHAPAAVCVSSPACT